METARHDPSKPSKRIRQRPLQTVMEPTGSCLVRRSRLGDTMNTKVNSVHLRVHGTDGFRASFRSIPVDSQFSIFQIFIMKKDLDSIHYFFSQSIKTRASRRRGGEITIVLIILLLSVPMKINCNYRDLSPTETPANNYHE